MRCNNLTTVVQLAVGWEWFWFYCYMSELRGFSSRCNFYYVFLIIFIVLFVIFEIIVVVLCNVTVHDCFIFCVIAYINIFWHLLRPFRRFFSFYFTRLLEISLGAGIIASLLCCCCIIGGGSTGNAVVATAMPQG